MVWCQAALAAMALSGTGDTVFLDFYADWCGPCRAMGPTIDALIEKGYPVRKINVDRHPELAAKYGVKNLPCYVMLAGGREVDRVTGGTTFSRVERMCKAGLAQVPPSGPPPVPAQFAATRPPPDRTSLPGPSAKDRQPPQPGWTPMDTKNAADMKLIAASVRLRIEDPDGYSWGSGTIIDSREGEALILTCAHIFRDSRGKGRIDVDLFGSHAGQRIPGRLISYDLQRDVGLLSIRAPGPVAVARVAPPEYRVGPDSSVVSVGCNNGDRPSTRHSRVASLNTILRPPSLKVAGLPVEGRSGGGLFSRDGLVIGVCYAADPHDGQGLYASLASVYNELDRTRLSYVYRPENQGPASPAGGQAPRTALVAVDPPPMPKQMPRSSGGWSPARLSEVSLDPAPARRWQSSDNPSGPSSPELGTAEQAALDEIRRRLDEGAEVICVVRSRRDPNAKSEIFMLDKVSPAFLRQLAAEAGAQRQRTTVAVP